MAGTELTTLERVDAVLRSLPEGFCVASSGEARLAVGPPGGFVVVAVGVGTTPDDRAAGRAAGLAATTRSDLADHLAWVPFIDAVVVTTAPTSATGAMDPAATAVPLDLLDEVLTEGPSVIEEAVLGIIADLLAGGRLSPWVPGHGAGAAKIDLCQPAPDTTPTR